MQPNFNLLSYLIIKHWIHLRRNQLWRNKNGLSSPIIFPITKISDNITWRKHIRCSKRWVQIYDKLFLERSFCCCESNRSNSWRNKWWNSLYTCRNGNFLGLLLTNFTRIRFLLLRIYTPGIQRCSSYHHKNGQKRI